MTGEERRRFPRLTMDTEIEYSILDRAGKEHYTTGSKNISSGGLCIIVIERLEYGAVLNLKFSLPDLKKIINAKGKVAWVKELRIGTKRAGDFYEAGIEFMEINKSDRDKIKDYVVSKLGRMKAVPAK